MSSRPDCNLCNTPIAMGSCKCGECWFGDVVWIEGRAVKVQEAVVGHNKPPHMVELTEEQREWLESELYGAMDINLKLLQMPTRTKENSVRIVAQLEMIKAIKAKL